MTSIALLMELDSQIAGYVMAGDPASAEAAFELREESAYELYKLNRAIPPERIRRRQRGQSYHHSGDKCPE